MKPIVLVKTNFNTHVSMDLYSEFEKSIIKSINPIVINSANNFQAKILRYFLKILPQFEFPYNSKRNYLVIGNQKEKLFPFFYCKANLKALWMFDAWEPLFFDIENTIRKFNINILFTSSMQAATYFNSLKIQNFKSHWIAEAVDFESYTFVEPEKKTIDVLQMGRKWDEYHEAIKDIEIEEKLVYKYEKKKGKIIFKDRIDFISGLANTKISICVPSIITHPEKSGNISTLTIRYFQSMASKCLILGKRPLDMEFLFDYNPIIEIDMKRPVEQLVDILKNYNEYLPLIEKNYNEVKLKHTWNNRAMEIKNIIDKF